MAPEGLSVTTEGNSEKFRDSSRFLIVGRYHPSAWVPGGKTQWKNGMFDRENSHCFKVRGPKNPDFWAVDLA